MTGRTGVLAWRPHVPSFVDRRLRAVLGGRRGSAQLGLVLTAVAVAGGMTLGSGVASHAARSGYDQAWVGDSSRGQAVQIDPVLGRANVRLQVGKPGDTLTIQQGNGQLIVINRRTGRISSIDLGTLLVGGSRAGARGDAVKVLLAGSRLYVADLPRGTIQAVDPATEASVGRAWSAGRSLVDVSVDSTHEVWALDAAQHLVDLRWDAAHSTLAPLSTRAVQGAGAGSVLVGHSRGVTLVGSSGTILRVGTGHDTSLTAPDVHGPLHGPMSSPDQLVPVADAGSGQVVIVGASDAVVDDVAALGCPTPGAPTVFDGKVYVPCVGSHKVLVLTPSGQQAQAAIPVPGGDAQLTVSGGHLIINAPNEGSATVVDSSGKSTSFPTLSHGVGVQDPNQTPSPPPDPPSPQPPALHPANPRDHHPGSTNGDVPDRGHGTSTTGGSSPSVTPSGPASAGAPNPGASRATATAVTRPDGSVLVSWVAADPGGSVTVARADNGTQVAAVAAGGSSATVTVLDPGTTVSFSVTGLTAAGRPAWTAATNTVTIMTAPGGVSGVTVTAVRNGNQATLTVNWSPASGHGGRVSYTVSTDASSARTTTSATHASLTVPCDGACSGSVTVAAANTAGAGTSAAGSYSVSAVAASTPPANNPPAPNPPAPNPPAPNPPAPNPPAPNPPAPNPPAPNPPAPNPPAPNPPAPNPPAPNPPAPDPLPAGGQTAITYTTTAGSDNTGDPGVAHLTITNPADWRAFSGTCALTDNGTVTDDTVPCSASGLTIDKEYYVTGTHVFTITASDAGGSVSSASVSVHVVYRPYTGCNGSRFAAGPVALPPCQIPFAQGAFGRAAAPHDVPSSARSAVDVLRSIW